MVFVFSTGFAPTSLINFYFLVQTFCCTDAPLFDVHSMLFSPSSKNLVLIGERGISVVEMPMRWGKFAEYDGGSEEVLCRYCSDLMPILIILGYSYS